MRSTEMILRWALLLLALMSSCLSFTSVQNMLLRPSLEFTTLSMENDSESTHSEFYVAEQERVCDRRTVLGMGLIATTLFSSQPAMARDEIFRPNPLTNPFLEQVRIWEQAEADNLKYGGELEAGDAGNKGKVSAYPRLLAPILEIDKELSDVRTLVRDEDRAESWPKALKILQNEKYEKISFKKTFNAYGDNIYYSDPDRANLYLGGGATPKTEQSLAYLLRNDILTNVENLRAELEYLLKSKEDDVEDLYSYADIVTRAMTKYLALVPPGELAAAKDLLAGSIN